MFKIGKRLEPEEGIQLKLGDKVVYEIIYDNGEVGTITAFVSEFDMSCIDQNTDSIIFYDPDKKEKYL